MRLFGDMEKRGRFYRITAALMAALLLFCSLGAGQIRAGAESLTTYTVDTLANDGEGSMRQAIDAVIHSTGDFKIVITAQGTLITTSPLPGLIMRGRSGWIEGNPDAVITGFSCVMYDRSSLTLKDVHIDDSAYDLLPLGGNESSLFLIGRNTIHSANRYTTIHSDHLVIDKAPGGSDLDSTLAVSGAPTAITGVRTSTLINGGTIELHGTGNGVGGTDFYLFVTGGKVLATGSYAGVNQHDSEGGVVISGGTVVARGGQYDIFAADLVIIGGSVKQRDSIARDGSGTRVYLVTVTVGEPPVRNTEVACSVNGGAAFTCITDEEGKLYLWMPEGHGAAEIHAGGTVYSVSGPVEPNYDNVMPAPVVTGVVVTPSSARAVSGSSIQFSARVEGHYSPPQDVAWAVENAHWDTAIDGNGLLTISLYESSRALLVTATSTYDPSQSGAARVSVLSMPWIVLGAVLLFLLLVLLVIFLEMGSPFRRG